jgi:hypothetical protein
MLKFRIYFMDIVFNNKNKVMKYNYLHDIKNQFKWTRTKSEKIQLKTNQK